MLKKYHFGTLVLLGLVLGFVPVQADQSVQFTPAFGIMWDHDYLFFCSLGLSVDFYLDKYFTITPEFYMANRDCGLKVRKDREYTFRFLQPGVMLNYNHPSFFVGAGVVKSYQARNVKYYKGLSVPRTVVWEVMWSSEWKLKLNAGFKISQIRFTLFSLSDRGYYTIGALFIQRGVTIGYTF